MNYTQNERIAQVGDNTLVVGIDIGSDKHYARAFTERGMEISRKAFVFENTESGFGLLDAWMEKLAGENGKAKIMVGFETAFVIVAPQQVKHSKELDDNTQRKDDRKDPRVIAKLVIEGRYSIAYMPEGKFAELRIVYNRRCELVEQQTRVMNQITRWFDIYFPEYRTVYGKVDAISGMMVLKSAPLPKDILELGAEGINAIWRDAKLKGAGMKRAACGQPACKGHGGHRGFACRDSRGRKDHGNQRRRCSNCRGIAGGDRQHQAVQQPEADPEARGTGNRGEQLR